MKERLRENQRACRIRRQELIDGLRNRVRELEERDVQATVAMQSAARAVEWENSRLRVLLSSRGVSAGEIDAFLRSETGSSPADQHQQNTAALKPIQNDGSQACSQPSPIPTHAFTGGCTARGACIATASPVESNISLAPKPTAMVTLCDKAAVIIADAHGHRDTEYALNALGCSQQTKDCVVNNVKIFDIIGQTL